MDIIDNPAGLELDRLNIKLARLRAENEYKDRSYSDLRNEFNKLHAENERLRRYIEANGLLSIEEAAAAPAPDTETT